MKDKLEQLKARLGEELSAAADGKTLEELRVSYLGKKGSITDLLKGMKSLSNEAKKEFGQQVNALKQEAAQRIAQRAEELKQLEIQREIDSTPAFDLTIPTKEDRGSYHPITLVQRECERIFTTMGFNVEDYPEVVTDYKKYGKQLMENGMPIRAIFPGRCFRNEATDATHENTFFQMEGVMVDKDISISNLIYFMKTMLSEVFQKDVKVRLRPGFFPFVEPGFELDISCLICGGETGCPSCNHSGWLELCPCGMIHPEVLKEGGIDPEKYTGFAFGLGLTRLAMMKYGIKDIRDLNSGSLKVMSQFTDDK